MTQAVNIPQSIDEKGSLDDGTLNEPYSVPSLNVDLSMEPDKSRKRRFSVSAESNANDDSDFEDENDDDSKSSQSNKNNENNKGNGKNENGNNKHNMNNMNNNNNNKNKHFIRKIYPKAKSAIARIHASVSDLFLWNGLDIEQQKLLIDAMFEKKVAKNESVITQGDRGDYFYVIESGFYEVWKSESKKGKHNSMLSQSSPKKVFEYDNKGSFGELALMYNSPRAATVKAKTDGILWAVDRKTFRHIIVGSTARKRHRYDKFLKKIGLFDDISETTQAQIADILEGFEFRQGEVIIEQASNDCQKFYMIQHGTANVVIQTNDSKTHIVSTLKEGDFFGERALLLNDVRSASVIVTSKSFVCCAMDKASFVRLLEGLDDKFYVKMDSYTYKDDLDNSNNNNDADLADIGSDQDDN